MSEKTKLQEILRKQLVSDLLETPIQRGTPGCYAELAKKYNTSSEYVRRVYRTLREGGLVQNDQLNSKAPVKSNFEENVKKGEASLVATSPKDISSLEDLIKFCKIDTEIWEIERWVCNKWEVGAKDHGGIIRKTPLFQVKAWLTKRKLAVDLGKQKQAILEEIKGFSPKVKAINYGSGVNLSPKMLEICIFDPHFGKLAWREETDEDYDLKIAESRVKRAVADLLTRVNLAPVEKILFPVGNDLINIDNRHNTTFAGTPQDSDCRYMKIIKTVRRILVEIIDELSLIAPVDVIIVPGNHDTTSSFMMGEILEAFFHNNERVNVDNTPKLRKYYQYGKVGIQLTHGDQEKHESLGGIFATEQKMLWAATDYRFAQLGHFHKNKKLTHVSVDEHQGFQVHVLPSLSGTDFWHKSKGYNSLKQAKAMLFDPLQGMVGEFTHNSPVPAV